MTEYQAHIASPEELERIWEKDVAANGGDERWLRWREEYIRYNRLGMAVTFVVTADGDPVGQGTLILSPDCKAVSGRPLLCDGITTGNVNALRIEKEHEGKHQISAMMRTLEAHARRRGLTALTIGVEAAKTRNIGIYLHWGYTEYVMHEEDEDGLVLYYRKELA